MDPNTGRAYLNPDLSHKGLVPAPHMNRNQQRRSSVMRNEPCPCGSGKKFKKCCLSKCV